eukprot:Hpha_TRINITY_DN12227_c0_g1::TRINITY_DN12227_c0_g1_i2::g.16654::m.16654
MVTSAVDAAGFYSRVGLPEVFSRAAKAVQQAQHPDALRLLADHFVELTQPPPPVDGAGGVTPSWLERVVQVAQGCVGNVECSVEASRGQSALRLLLTSGRLGTPLPERLLLRLYVDRCQEAEREIRCSQFFSAHDALREHNAPELLLGQLVWSAQGTGSLGEVLCNVLLTDPRRPPLRPLGLSRGAEALAGLHAGCMGGRRVDECNALRMCLPPWGRPRDSSGSVHLERARRWAWLSPTWTCGTAEGRLPRHVAVSVVTALRWEGTFALLGPIAAGSEEAAVGLREGMVLSRLNGQPVRSPEAVRRILGGLPAEPSPEELAKQKAKGDSCFTGAGPLLGERQPPAGKPPRRFSVEARDLRGFERLWDHTIDTIGSEEWKRLRVVCHGNPDGSCFVDSEDGPALTDFSAARIGHPAEDLAHWAVCAGPSQQCSRRRQLGR